MQEVRALRIVQEGQVQAETGRDIVRRRTAMLRRWRVPGLRRLPRRLRLHLAAGCLTAANFGDTIRLCPGRYPTNAVFNKDLTLIGAGSGAGGTILDGQDRGSVLDITGIIEMRGFTITGGQAATGAGIRAYRVTLRLEDVHLADHQSSGAGGAINSDRGEITLINTRITGSSAERGGGIYNGLNSVLILQSNSAITGNSASGSGGGPDDPVAGGIHNAGASVHLLDGSSVTGNTPVNCIGTSAC